MLYDDYFYNYTNNLVFEHRNNNQRVNEYENHNQNEVRHLVHLMVRFNKVDWYFFLYQNYVTVTCVYDNLVQLHKINNYWKIDDHLVIFAVNFTNFLNHRNSVRHERINLNYLIYQHFDNFQYYDSITTWKVLFRISSIYLLFPRRFTILLSTLHEKQCVKY